MTLTSFYYSIRYYRVMNKTLLKKIIILTLIGAVIALYFILDLGRYMNLSYLKASREHFQILYQNHGIMVTGLFFLFYVVVTALSLPGAAVMTVAAGALFGLGMGTLIVSFASTIGATLAFIISRFLLQNWVQTRFGHRVEKINKGLEEEGKFYLFTLRLIPIFPFWLINIAMGLTTLRIWTFYWVSQIGMLPGTVVYVNAGKELSGINSLSDIMSLRVIISFALLGLFPLVAKKLINLYRGTKKGPQGGF